MSGKIEEFKKKNIKFKFYGDIDEIIDEKGSMYIALRKTAWYDEDKGAPSEDKAKLELRKWKVNEAESDKDIPQKGVSFLTEEGPHNLAVSLVKTGYGDTKELLKELKTRNNFKDSVQHMYDEDDTNEEGFFDARNDLLLEA